MLGGWCKRNRARLWEISALSAVFLLLGFTMLLLPGTGSQPEIYLCFPIMCG